jgi:hypothetical protein
MAYERGMPKIKNAEVERVAREVGKERFNY